MGLGSTKKENGYSKNFLKDDTQVSNEDTKRTGLTIMK